VDLHVGVAVFAGVDVMEGIGVMVGPGTIVAVAVGTGRTRLLRKEQDKVKIINTDSTARFFFTRDTPSNFVTRRRTPFAFREQGSHSWWTDDRAGPTDRAGVI
jgi:hypothetical protein